MVDSHLIFSREAKVIVLDKEGQRGKSHSHPKMGEDPLGDGSHRICSDFGAPGTELLQKG